MSGSGMCFAARLLIKSRNTYAPEPFIEYFDESGEGPFTLRYSELANITFTGKDTAAGNSWKAWLERKEREKAERAAARSVSDPDPHRG